MTRLLPLFLLVACSRTPKQDPNVRDRMAQLAAVCSDSDNAAQIAHANTFSGVQGQ